MINYREVATDLRARAAKLIEAAGILEGFMTSEELTTPLAAVAPTAPPTKKHAKPRNLEDFLEGKKDRVQLPGNLPSVRLSILQALAESPLYPTDLTERVLQLRPGTNPREISKAAWSLRKNFEITKDGAGKWIPFGDSSKAPEPPAAKPPSLTDVIRQAAAEAVERTSTELTDRVLDLLPGSNRSSVGSLILQLIAKRELYKTDELKVRPVVNGRVQQGLSNGNGAHA